MNRQTRAALRSKTASFIIGLAIMVGLSFSTAYGLLVAAS